MAVRDSGIAGRFREKQMNMENASTEHVAMRASGEEQVFSPRARLARILMFAVMLFLAGGVVMLEYGLYEALDSQDLDMPAVRATLSLFESNSLPADANAPSLDPSRTDLRIMASKDRLPRPMNTGP